MARNTSFGRDWGNQTDIGKEYGLSSIAVGKVLIKEGLRDAATKKATERALDEGYAKHTPMIDGRDHYMWSRSKLKALFQSKSQPAEPSVDLSAYVSTVLDAMQAAQAQEEIGEGFLAELTVKRAYNAVPEALREAVRAEVQKKAKSNALDDAIHATT